MLLEAPNHLVLPQLWLIVLPTGGYKSNIGRPKNVDHVISPEVASQIRNEHRSHPIVDEFLTYWCSWESNTMMPRVPTTAFVNYGQFNYSYIICSYFVCNEKVLRMRWFGEFHSQQHRHEQCVWWLCHRRPSAGVGPWPAQLIETNNLPWWRFRIPFVSLGSPWQNHRVWIVSGPGPSDQQPTTPTQCVVTKSIGLVLLQRDRRLYTASVDQPRHRGPMGSSSPMIITQTHAHHTHTLQQSAATVVMLAWDR